jgi:sialate O-acetylesterase
MKNTLLSVISLLFCIDALAQVKLPRIFNDDMVLQRDRTIPVWGWAKAKEKITVQFNQQSKAVVAAKDGKWRIDLDAEPAGGPYTLQVKGTNSINIKNVLVGDVWICSGQSNMEMPIGAWGFINNYQEEIKNADYPLIRQFLVPKTTSASPLADLTGGNWQACSPSTAAGFSATAYFFARDLYKQLNIPIGLINTSWGGTHVETWTSKEAFENSPEFSEMIAGMKSISIEELIKERDVIKAKNLRKFQGDTPPTADEIDAWKNSSFDDSKWMKIKAPGMWENQQLEDFDGVVWYRKTIDIPSSAVGKPATLSLAMIDDADVTYINGQQVGATNGYNLDRRYAVPAGVLKTGKNVIAIRVDDTGGGGGIYGDSAAVKLTIGELELSLAGEWAIQVESGAPVSTSIGPNSFPTLLFNGMINPLLPFAIKGAIWYQGETNAGRAYQYRKAFPLMINDWRKQWKQGDFPFYFVQLASWNANNGNSQKGSDWAELREAQSMTLSLPNTGMAVTTDIGDAKDIHPKNKQDVGKRLASIALNKTYGKANVYSGPVYQSHRQEGNKIIITFNNIGSGLNAKDKYGYLRGFEVAGADKIFYYAKAFIEADKVVVYSESVGLPVAVRFGWADDAGENNLFNKEGFPAAPFRTDEWKGITEEVKYGIGK